MEKGDVRIQKICEALKVETLEPAKLEAKKIVEQAKAQAEEIVREGQKQKDHLIESAHQMIKQERAIFHSSLEQAGKQSLEELKAVISDNLFNKELDQVLSKEIAQPDVVAKLIAAMIQAIEKEGLSANFSAVISKSAGDINKLLGKAVMEKLPIEIGSLSGGAKLKLHDKKMTIDMSDAAIKELLSNYLRKDFRTLLFGNEQ